MATILSCTLPLRIPPVLQDEDIRKILARLWQEERKSSLVEVCAVSYRGLISRRKEYTRALFQLGEETFSLKAPLPFLSLYKGET